MCLHVLHVLLFIHLFGYLTEIIYVGLEQFHAEIVVNMELEVVEWLAACIALQAFFGNSSLQGTDGITGNVQQMNIVQEAKLVYQLTVAIFINDIQIQAAIVNL